MNIVIAAGGTAGHINPGISIANTIKKYYPDAKITFIGTEYGLEGKLVPRAGYDIKFIHSKGLSKSPVKLLKSVVANSRGLFEAKKLLKELKPKIVIGMGGYVCAPVLFVAKKMLHIPVFIHESNSIAGKTNKFIGNFADGIAVGFEQTKKEFRSKVVFVTGNPVNQSFFNIVKQKDSENTVLIFGGSQGAKGINDTVIKMINERKLSYKIIYATGEKNYLDVKNSLNIEKYNNDVTILPYINNMADMFSKVSLVVARGGALTISELRAAKMPAILIPLPTAAENHQEFNARAFAENGCGTVILEKDLNEKVLNSNIEKMLKNTSKNNMTDVENADEKIFRMIRPYLDK